MSIFPSASGEIQSDEWKFSSIGGWLIPVTIGLCISPLLQAVFIITNLLPIFRNGAWSRLTTPGSASFHPLWGPVIIFELLMNLALIAIEAMLLVWLFRKSKLFPKAMIAYFLIVFVLVAIDYFLASQIPIVARLNDAESRGTLIRSGLLCAIWIPYFVRSRRVKGTFTN